VNAKGNVAVYNSVGQRIMEKTVTGNQVKFDVSGLQKGLYFIKTSDGTTQKFIR
ncbi:MAG: T9SS type A sorting domain-containing protein, partial [Candidatus Saccharibacteria bacterium]